MKKIIHFIASIIFGIKYPPFYRNKAEAIAALAVKHDLHLL